MRPPAGAFGAEDAAFTTGAWFGVACNGLAAMRSLGVAAAVTAEGFPSESIEFTSGPSGTGKRLGELPIGGRLEDGTGTLTLKRADLCRVLSTSAAKLGIPFHYGKRFAGAARRQRRRLRSVRRRLRSARRLSDRRRRPPLARAPRDRSRRPAARFTGLGNIGGYASGVSTHLPLGRFQMMFGKRAFFG